MIRALIYKYGEREVKLNVKTFLFFSIGLQRIPKREYFVYGWRSFFLPGKRKIEDKNTQTFVNWIIKQLKQTGVKVEQTNQYDSTSLYLNTHNLERLRKYLPSMVWMNYSPTTCDELKNNEIAVNLSAVRARR